MPRGGTITVSAEIANTGAREADEVAQLYVRDLVASVARPVRELKGFRRLHLKPGEKQTVSFTLSEKDLAFYNEAMQLVAEPGEFDVWIAPDSVYRRFRPALGSKAPALTDSGTRPAPAPAAPRGSS